MYGCVAWLSLHGTWTALSERLFHTASVMQQEVRINCLRHTPLWQQSMLMGQKKTHWCQRDGKERYRIWKTRRIRWCEKRILSAFPSNRLAFTPHWFPNRSHGSNCTALPISPSMLYPRGTQPFLEWVLLKKFLKSVPSYLFLSSFPKRHIRLFSPATFPRVFSVK